MMLGRSLGNIGDATTDTSNWWTDIVNGLTYVFNPGVAAANAASNATVDSLNTAVLTQFGAQAGTLTYNPPSAALPCATVNPDGTCASGPAQVNNASGVDLSAGQPTNQQLAAAAAAAASASANVPCPTGYTGTYPNCVAPPSSTLWIALGIGAVVLVAMKGK